MRLVLLFALFFSLSDHDVFAQQADPGEHIVQLVYDDLALPDSARAKLISLLQQFPHDTTSITVQPADQTYTKLIQNHFFLSGKTDRFSVAAMIHSVMQLNNLPPSTVPWDSPPIGVSLVAPALPLHGFRTNNLADKPVFRVSGVGELLTSTASTVSDLPQLNQLPQAREARNGDLTAKLVAAPRYLANLAWKSRTTSVLPPGVRPLEDGGNIRIHLAATDSCDAKEWLGQSPLAPQLRPSLKALLTSPTTTSLLSTNTSLPLIVIDWNDSITKHGQKVTSVIKGVLADLILTDLPFHEVDLNPANNAPELRNIFNDYLNNYYCHLQGINCKAKGQKGLIDDVNAWLSSKPQAINGIATLKQLLLEAVLWKYFAASKAVVNMSFSVDSLALEILQAQFLSASHSIGIVAVSDDPGPQGTAGIPQRAASIYPNFINVTYGNYDGTLLGAGGNNRFNIIVTTAAQGCGFHYDEISPSDAGTSFAAPYVAVGVWLKTFMGIADLSATRQAIVRASHVSRALTLPSTESAGPFDLAMFLLPEIQYILAPSGLQQISSAKVFLEMTPIPGQSRTLTYEKGDQVSISFLRTTAGAIVARIRSPRIDNVSPLPVTDVMDRILLNGTVDVTLSDGGRVFHYDLKDLTDLLFEIKL